LTSKKRRFLADLNTPNAPDDPALDESNFLRRFLGTTMQIPREIADNIAMHVGEFPENAHVGHLPGNAKDHHVSLFPTSFLPTVSLGPSRKTYLRSTNSLMTPDVYLKTQFYPKRVVLTPNSPIEHDIRFRTETLYRNGTMAFSR